MLFRSPNARQTAPLRVSGLHLSPPRHLTNQAADSMLFLSKSCLFGILPTKFPEYPIPVFKNIIIQGFGKDWDFSSTVISVQYVRDTRETNLVHTIQVRGKEILFNGEVIDLQQKHTED